MKQNKYISNNKESNSLEKKTNIKNTINKNSLNNTMTNNKNKAVKLKESSTKSSSTNKKNNNKKTLVKNIKIKNEVKKKEKIIFDLKLTKKEITKLINNAQKDIQTKKSSDNIFINNLSSKEKKILQNLSDKQQNLYNNIEKINIKQNYLNECSLNNINKKNMFYKNIQSDNIKSLEEEKENLLLKLSNINQQIKDFKNNIKLNNNVSNYKYLEKIKQEKNFNEITKKIKILQIQSNISSKKRLEEAELNQEKRNKNLDLLEREEIEEKDKELINKINEEKKIVELRKKEMNIKTEKIKPFINNIFEKGRNKNYLYIKMATSFEKNEEEYKNKILKNKLNDEKERNKKLDKKDFITKKKLELVENSKILHQIWKERTDLLPKYVSPMYGKVISSENYIKENEKNRQENKKRLFDLRQKYGKEKVHLPLISNILQRKNDKKDMKTKILKSGIQKHVNNSAMNIKVIQINKRNSENIVEKKIVKNNLTEKKKFTKSYSYTNFNNNLKNNISNSNKSNIILENNSAESQKKNSEKNNINEIRRNKLLINKKLNKDVNKANGINVDVIKGKIEMMEDKYKRGKELIKAKGGYIQNKELGDQMNNILIDSIKNKLDIIENLYK